jgi:hypothetical protein
VVLTVFTMSVNQLLRVLSYTVAIVISLIVTVVLFAVFYIDSGFSKWVAATLYQIFPDSKFLQILGQRVGYVIGLTIAGFLFSAIFFRSGFSRCLKNALLRVFPDLK